MKYIISESRLDKVVFKYLDSKNFVRVKSGDDIFFVKDKSGKPGYLRYDTNDGWLYVLRELAEDIDRFFSLSEEETDRIIGQWVGSLVGRVSMVDRWASQTAFIYKR